MSTLSRFALVVALAATAAACSNDSPTAPSTGSAPFQVVDIRVGTGAEATNGRTVSVAYVGWLYSTSAAENKGTRFDGGTISFVLGAGQVIRGWDQGILGMRIGGQRRLVIPPELAYGSAGAGNAIPPNATLVFDVELQGVR